MGDLSLVERFRSWLAGCLFALAGKLDESYDVWLDDAPSRRDSNQDSDPARNHDA